MDDPQHASEDERIAAIIQYKARRCRISPGIHSLCFMARKRQQNSTGNADFGVSYVNELKGVLNNGKHLIVLHDLGFDPFNDDWFYQCFTFPRDLLGTLS
mmetsp:Transcript_3482/g.5148  ORF Transcript_3482/g.5148 Transcript_3482/m.5148 type:complete len:100 (-) Transcript_3482:1081-1380(-)